MCWGWSCAGHLHAGTQDRPDRAGGLWRRHLWPVDQADPRGCALPGGCFQEARLGQLGACQGGAGGAGVHAAGGPVHEPPAAHHDPAVPVVAGALHAAWRQGVRLAGGRGAGGAPLALPAPGRRALPVPHAQGGGPEGRHRLLRRPDERHAHEPRRRPHRRPRGRGGGQPGGAGGAAEGRRRPVRGRPRAGHAHGGGVGGGGTGGGELHRVLLGPSAPDGRPRGARPGGALRRRARDASGPVLPEQDGPDRARDLRRPRALLPPLGGRHPGRDHRL
mmetsp:Transcript_10107/g.17190  ORF Transcript_10107/g.17190 Transcript_10107/m.17190 type:complete len:276 (+) Transcript_10107:369-1196(+)